MPTADILRPRGTSPLSWTWDQIPTNHHVTDEVAAGETDHELYRMAAGMHAVDEHIDKLMVTLENAPGGGKTVTVTTDRWDSYSPGWSADGEWLYFLSDRNLQTIVGSPWGAYQPEPYLDKTTQVFHIPLVEGLRSPFAPENELAASFAMIREHTAPNVPPALHSAGAGVAASSLAVPVDDVVNTSIAMGMIHAPHRAMMSLSDCAGTVSRRAGGTERRYSSLSSPMAGRRRK